MMVLLVFLLKMNKFFCLVIPIFILVLVIAGLLIESKICSIESYFFLGVVGVDKLFHGIAFFCLALVCHGAFLCFCRERGEKWKGKKGKHLFLLGLVFLGIFFAGLTEWLQESFTITRNGDVFDFFSDLLGIFFYIIFYRFFLIRFFHLFYLFFSCPR